MSLKSLHHRGHAAAAEQSPADSPWWELTLRQPYLKGTSAFIAHSHFPQHTISRPQLFLYVFWPVSRVSLWWQKASTQSVLEVNIYCKLLCVRVCVCVCSCYDDDLRVEKKGIKIRYNLDTKITCLSFSFSPISKQTVHSHEHTRSISLSHCYMEDWKSIERHTELSTKRLPTVGSYGLHLI